MKIFAFILLGLLSIYHNPAKSTEFADEASLRSAVIMKLLHTVGLQETDLSRIEGEDFNLCVYKSFPTYRNIKKNTAGETLSNRPVAVFNVSSAAEISQCHAIYVGASHSSAIAQTVRVANKERVVVVGESRNAAKLGAHLGMFVGDKNLYEFELNLDSFARIGVFPQAGLIELGTVISSHMVQKAKLMRSLVGYTEWPKPVSASPNLTFCAEYKDFFTEYSRYLFTQKPIQSKTTQFQYLDLSGDEKQQLNKCDILLLNGYKNSRLASTVFAREKRKMLLIGDALGLGDKGVHYNLTLPDDNGGRRFEINLFAFEQTGHLPHYQLLNSALIVQRDIPLFSILLAKAVKYTIWPIDGPAANSPNLCVWRKEDEFESLSFFNVEIRKFNQDMNILNVSDESNLPQCSALLVSNVTFDTAAELSSLQQKYGFLLITNTGDAGKVGAHYNLKVAHKKITLELFEDNMKKAGFKPQKVIMDESVVIGGSLK